MKPFNQISLALIFILLFFINLNAAPGDLDPSFNGTGFTKTLLGDSDEVLYASTIQADGKILAAGSASNGSDYDFALVRYNPDGSLDATFDTDGKVLTPIGAGNDRVFAVAMQTDGKIVAAGLSNNVNDDFAVVRYNANGSLDTTFGTNGKITTPIGTAGDIIYSIIIQSDGKIVAAGTSRNGSLSNFAVVRYNSDGSLDTTFGTNGKVSTSINASNSFSITAVMQADGKIVLAGNSSNGANSDFAAVRYNTDGSLDTTFGTNGKVVTPIGTGNEFGYSVALQTDGKIVVAGSSSNGSNEDFAVVRYNTDGSLDTTFNGNGKVTTPIGTGGDFAYSVAVQTDGKIIAAGGSIGANTDFAVVRYNANGSLDNSFGTNGKVITPIQTSVEYANAVVIQIDGKIIAAGLSNNSVSSDFALVRYNTDGSLDLTFDTDGKLITRELGSNATLQAIAIQTDGKIVAVGSAYNGANTDFAAVRYNTNGSLDTTFGTNGKVITSFSPTRGSGAFAVAIQPDGKIVAAGLFSDTTTDFALVRYNTDGSLDTTFDVDGKVTTPIGTSGDEAYSVAIQTDGKIVVAGYSVGANADFAVVRYNADGSLDTTFNASGKVTTPIGTGADFARSVKIQTDGKIVSAGDSISGSNRDFAVVRYNPNGSLDASFDADGKLTTPIGTANDIADSVALQSDGKIVAAGSSNNFGADSSFALVRYNANGSLDTTFGANGKVTTQIGSDTDYINSIVIQTDGKIVAAGANFIDSATYDYALARYNADGSLDSSFGTGGIVKTNLNKVDTIGSAALQTDGKIVLGGTSGSQFTIVRYFGRFLYEADVSPRQDGDGFVDSDDIQQIRILSVGGGLPYQSGEFQRADCAPRSTSGDGFVDGDDVQQARRYSVGTDSTQIASGPAAGAVSFLSDSSAASIDKAIGNLIFPANKKSNKSPAFYIGSQRAGLNQTIFVPILVDTTGKEAGYTFSLSYDATVLTNPQVTIGNAGGDVVYKANTAGEIGISVTSFSGETIASGANQVLVNVTFTVAADATGTTSINFTDTLARRKASGIDPNIAVTQPTYTSGIITIGAAKMIRNSFGITND